MRAEVLSEDGGYRWRNRPAEWKPGGSRPLGSCSKAWDGGLQRRPADFANGIRVVSMSIARLTDMALSRAIVLLPKRKAAGEPRPSGCVEEASECDAYLLLRCPLKRMQSSKSSPP